MSKTKINVYIAKHERDDYLKTCLHYLNLANVDKKRIITLFITDDNWKHILDKNKPASADFNNLDIIWSYRNCSDVFNKSKLLNNGLLLGNTSNNKPDIHTIIDIDMIYPSNFFDLIEEKVKTGHNYIVSTGYKLNKNSVRFLQDPSNIAEVDKYIEEEFTVGPSQISITNEVYNLFTTIWGNDLYDERYEFWGGEDSLVSYKSMELERQKLINKCYIHKMWRHIWHERSWSINKDHDVYYKRNMEIFNKSISTIKSEVDSYVNARR